MSSPKRIILKLKQRFARMKGHPLTKTQPYKALWRYVYLHLYFLVYKQYRHSWIGNLHLDIQKGDAGIIGNVYYGLYEYSESLFVLHYLRADDYFLDVGANMGHYSLLAAGISRCRTISLEPVPATFDRLQQQIRLNGLEDRIDSRQVGVSQQEGSLYFSTDRDVMNRVVDANYTPAVAVPVMVLDQIDSQLPIRLLKMDVEGFEYQALQGAASWLRHPALHAIILELNTSGSTYGVSDQKLVSLLEDYGYYPYQYEPFSRKLERLSGHNTTQFNTIFIRDLESVTRRVASAKPVRIFKQSI